jgi:hypothetical protein
VELIWWLLGGVVVGSLLGLYMARQAAPTVTRWILDRRANRNRPPKGTRPTVRLTYTGVTYDLTDDLVRLPDDDKGFAVWAVLGPQHLRMQAGNTGRLDIIHPIPMMTNVTMRMTGPPDAVRFETAEEIRETYGIT